MFTRRWPFTTPAASFTTGARRTAVKWTSFWTRAKRAVGIEVKASKRWRSEFGAPLKGLRAEGMVQAGFGVYAGSVELKDGPLRVLSLWRFLKLLARGDLFP